MKYQCQSCKKQFTHPAKQVKSSDAENHTLAIAAGTVFSVIDYTEFHVCPFCNSLEFSEYIEPQYEISSVKSVDLAAVDECLKQGYVVRELYAKTATLVKLEITT